uniref:DUF569 domain-containing protein n=1 Tax=Oryza glumipatula TaxID=40148 RepID=A0A0E0A5N7_9ORYZ
MVHILHLDGGDILMLHSAANGRYLAAPRTGWSWNSVNLRDLNQLPSFTVGWFAVTVGSGFRQILMGLSAQPTGGCSYSTGAMGRFHDRHHLWLRSREHGTYLQADLDDGSTLSLHPCRAAVRTAWTVHTIGRMLALHSAANGRYLAATAARFGLGGNRVILRDLDMFAAGWFPDMSASGDSIMLRHSSDQFLRAIDRGDGNGVTVEVSASRRANAHWVVEAIPSTDSIPRLPHIEMDARRH